MIGQTHRLEPRSRASDTHFVVSFFSRSYKHGNPDNHGDSNAGANDANNETDVASPIFIFVLAGQRSHLLFSRVIEIASD